MKNISVRTTSSRSNISTYKNNLNNVITFLNHYEDKICVLKSMNMELTEIQIYQNGEMLFSGDKYELFEKLKS